MKRVLYVLMALSLCFLQGCYVAMPVAGYITPRTVVYTSHSHTRRVHVHRHNHHRRHTHRVQRRHHHHSHATTPRRTTVKRYYRNGRLQRRTVRHRY